MGNVLINCCFSLFDPPDKDGGRVQTECAYCKIPSVLIPNVGDIVWINGCCAKVYTKELEVETDNYILNINCEDSVVDHV